MNRDMKERYQNLAKWNGNKFLVWVDSKNQSVVEVMTATAYRYGASTIGAQYQEIFRGDEGDVVKAIKEYGNG